MFFGFFDRGVSIPPKSPPILSAANELQTILFKRAISVQMGANKKQKLVVNAASITTQKQSERKQTSLCSIFSL